MIELLIFYKGESLIFSPNGKESGMNRNRHHMWTQLIIKRNLTAAEITCNQMSSWTSTLIAQPSIHTKAKSCLVNCEGTSVSSIFCRD